MLVLTRKTNESIVIRDNIVVTVTEINGDRVRLGIQAPKDVAILRRELYDKIKSSEVAAKGIPDRSILGNS